jgi:polysaccharide export outer membrane protein
MKHLIINILALFFIVPKLTAQEPNDKVKVRGVVNSAISGVRKIIKSDTTIVSGVKSVTAFDIPYDTIAYRIKVGDRLKIINLNSITTIFSENVSLGAGAAGSSQQANISQPFETTVNRYGQITMPQSGRIKVAGLTRIEATSEIEKSYDSTITNPIFEVELINLRIKVLGAVGQQGVFRLENERISLGEALAQAGGIDFATADKTIKLIRPRAGIQEELNFDVRDLSNPKITNIMIYDGDYIYVPPSKAALRNVKNQRASAILQPIALTLNVVALLIALFR